MQWSVEKVPFRMRGETEIRTKIVVICLPFFEQGHHFLPRVRAKGERGITGTVCCRYVF